MQTFVVQVEFELEVDASSHAEAEEIARDAVAHGTYPAGLQVTAWEA